MNVLDVNVLIALGRDDHEFHLVASEWLNASLDRGESFSVPDFVRIGYVRVTTNRRAFPLPTPPSQAFDFLDDISSQPGHLPWVTKPDTETVFRELVASGRVSGGGPISDAWIAALALSYGATLVTFDHGFGRYPGLKIHVPTAA